MADEIELRMDVQRAARAQVLLADETLTEAFTKLADEYRKAWENTSPNDSNQREKLYFAMRALPAVRHNLEVMLMNGSVSAKQLANLEEDKARLKRK